MVVVDISILRGTEFVHQFPGGVEVTLDIPAGAVDYLAHAGCVHHVPGGFAHLLDHGDCVIDVAEPF